MSTLPAPQAVAERYLASWNEPDAAQRRRLVALLWNPEGRYVDPMMKGTGHAGIADMIETARSQFPGLVFSPRGQADGHDRYLRFSWSLGEPGGPALAGGTDMVRLDDEGRICDVVGFLDPHDR